MRYYSVFLLVFFVSSLACAQSVMIGKKEFETVQMAINKAKPGDVIEVRGMQKGSLKINKKDITLRGEDPTADGILGTAGSVISADGEYGAESLTIENLTIANGTATENPGGGIMFKRVKGESILRNLMVRRNRTSKVGGGMMLAASKVTLENCWVNENYASEFGGGLAIQSGNAANSDVSIVNSVVSSNTSENHGGGIYVTGNPKWGDKKNLLLTINNSIITYNSSAKKGGAMFIKSAKHLDTEEGNIEVIMNHATVAYNRSTDEKGKLPGIAFYGEQGAEPKFAISNSLVVLNGLPAEPDMNFAKSLVSQNNHNIYSKVMGLKVADVDMSTSKIIANKERIGLSEQLTKRKGQMANLALSNGSAAINAALGDNTLNSDINGNTRTMPDIGAVEFIE